MFAMTVFIAWNDSRGHGHTMTASETKITWNDKPMNANSEQLTRLDEAGEALCDAMELGWLAIV